MLDDVEIRRAGDDLNFTGLFVDGSLQLTDSLVEGGVAWSGIGVIEHNVIVAFHPDMWGAVHGMEVKSGTRVSGNDITSASIGILLNGTNGASAVIEGNDIEAVCAIVVEGFFAEVDQVGHPAEMGFMDRRDCQGEKPLAPEDIGEVEDAPAVPLLLIVGAVLALLIRRR